MFNAVDLEALSNLLRAGENSLAAVLAGQDRRQQSAFWAHDLVRPFGPKGSIGSLEGILAGDFGPVPERIQGPLRLMSQDARFVQSHLENLLTASQEKSGETRGRPLTEAFLTTQERFEKHALEKGITWRVDPPHHQCRVHASPELIEHRVLSNLVENAMRHCPEGGDVTLGHRLDGKWLWGFVTNTHDGPEEIEFKKFFQPGVQFEPTKRGRAGLGLAIAKKTVEEFGGRVTIENTSGKQTTFTFSIPIVQ